MSTILVFTPFNAELPSSSPAELGVTKNRPYVAFGDSGYEYAHFTAVAPQGLPASLSLHIYFIMEAATSGSVVMEAAVEAVTPGDSLDLDAATSFDTYNSVTAGVPAAAGYLTSASVALSNDDSIEAGDLFRIALRRAGADASDTATGDCRVLALELRG